MISSFNNFFQNTVLIFEEQNLEKYTIISIYSLIILFFPLYFGKLNHPEHFVLYCVCSTLYFIYLLAESLSNGCLISYLGSHGKGSFLPFTFLGVFWVSVLRSGTLIAEPEPTRAGSTVCRAVDVSAPL